MQFTFFYPKDLQFFFFVEKTIDFVENLEMTQIAGGVGGSCSLRHCDVMRTEIDM